MRSAVLTLAITVAAGATLAWLPDAEAAGEQWRPADLGFTTPGAVVSPDGRPSVTAAASRPAWSQRTAFRPAPPVQAGRIPAQAAHFPRAQPGPSFRPPVSMPRYQDVRPRHPAMPYPGSQGQRYLAAPLPPVWQGPQARRWTPASMPPAWPAYGRPGHFGVPRLAWRADPSPGHGVATPAPRSPVHASRPPASQWRPAVIPTAGIAPGTGSHGHPGWRELSPRTTWSMARPVEPAVAQPTRRWGAQGLPVWRHDPRAPAFAATAPWRPQDHRPGQWRPHAAYAPTGGLHDGFRPLARAEGPVHRPAPSSPFLEPVAAAGQVESTGVMLPGWASTYDAGAGPDPCSWCNGI
jgi:hypothetical protein